MSQHKRQVKVYEGRAYGVKVSEYGLEHGYLDYYTLAEIVGDCILNNNIMMLTGIENWELTSGEELDEYDEYYDIYQYYIVTDSGARFLEEYTDEIVYYNEQLDMYILAITHFGTSWDYVLTDIKLV